MVFDSSVRQASTVTLNKLPEGFSIEKADTNHIEAMAVVTCDSWRKAFSRFLPPEVLAKGNPSFFFSLWKSILNDPKQHALVIMDNKEVIACGACGQYREQHNPISGLIHKHRAGELYRGYVAPDYQHQGLGSILLNARLRWLRQQGTQRVYTWIYAKNQQAQQFYKKHGATKVTQSKGVTMEKYFFDEVCYQLTLPSK
ncbi:GNAT family N-acetyltransferase [Pseudoalteromonas sp. T1lg65]|uniref:GNAT family N-acetyltransferase n=1 Tax=Pseudoalteromonas sp. T1lg65 TaxID=2077101 RepID=UPI003F797A1F